MQYSKLDKSYIIFPFTQSPRRFENPLTDNKCDIEKKEETMENITKSIIDSDEDYRKDEASENITKSIPDSDEDYKKEEM
jgi:hypothetical protein